MISFFVEAWIGQLLHLLIAAGFGAALFRMRGSAGFSRITGRGKTTADAAYAIGLAAITGPGLVWQMVAIAGCLWLGCRLPWWRSLTLGRSKRDGSVAMQWARHTGRGILWTLPAAVLAWLLGFQVGPLLFAGLMCAPLYEAGWRLDGRMHLGGTEWGEHFFGAAIGAALVVTFHLL